MLKIAIVCRSYRLLTGDGQTSILNSKNRTKLEVVKQVLKQLSLYLNRGKV